MGRTQGLVGQFGQGDPVVVGESAVGGEAGDKWLGEQRFQVDAWRRRGRAQEPGVPPDLAAVSQIAARHGITILAPPPQP
ncbi:hypothetical protein ACXC9Q_35310 [Kribbella sp. CWNU-51]